MWIVQLVDYRETRAPVIKEAANDVIKQSDTCVPLFIISPQLKRPEPLTDHSTQYSAKVILWGIGTPPPPELKSGCAVNNTTVYV